jgi:ribosomal protein S18 acetylase RimI-like enzyme
MLELRQARTRDLDALVELHEPLRKLYVQNAPDIGKQVVDPAEVRDFFEMILDDAKSSITVAEQNGLVVGFLWSHVVTQADGAFARANRHTYIIALAVAPSAQRRGIGTALLEHAKACALENDAGELMLDVYSTNEEARRFYEARGFLPHLTKMRLAAS